MKKQILTLGMMCAAAFALTNCDKQSTEPQRPTEGTPFEIIASAVDTKTTNDGLHTNWAEGDALNLFHAEAGSTVYGSNDKFTWTGEGNKFSGTLTENLETGKSYDWYALYPYDSYLSDPTGTAETGKRYVYIGDRSDNGQTQTGNDSKAHLIYSNRNEQGFRNCPLYAVAKSVKSSETPAFTMRNLASVVAVKVTNTTGNELTVSKVSFTAPEGTTIAGQYYIDFTKEEPIYNDGTYIGNVANLTVNEGSAIAKNGSATFYLAIKPFTAASGSTLKISVNGYEKSLEMPKDVIFNAGEIKEVAFNYDKASIPGTTVTKNISDISGTTEDGTKVSSMKMDDVITVSASTKGNNGKVYKSGAEWRFYQGDSGTLTITAAEGYTLKSATITYSIKNGGKLKYGESTISSDADVTLTGSKAVLSVGNSEDKSNGQVRITVISVTYE